MNKLPSFNAYFKGDPNNNGLNNASMLIFSKDLFNSVIKELTQNSIDAVPIKGDKLKLKIRMEKIKKSDITDLDSFKAILIRMKEFWKKNDDFVNYYDRGINLISEKYLNVFIFEDFNTSGLHGDCKSGTFNKLVIDEGSSEKEIENPLGGFGIGKNALFDYSRIKTVFYSSVNEKEGFKFMGVTKLGEYTDEEGKKRNNRLYYGIWNKDFPTEEEDIEVITDRDLVPAFFRRTECGLSSYALCAEETENWQELTIKALVRNYWFLFEKDLIEAEIDKELINKTNYFEVAKNIFTDDKTILSYIETFRNPQIKEREKIAHIGETEILIREAADGQEYPNKIVLIRDGMMIKEFTPGVGGLQYAVAGILYCNTPEGNRYISNMEPPRHDDLLPSLLPLKSPLSQKDGESIIKGLKDFRKKHVKTLKEKYSKPTTSVEFIDELISGLLTGESNGSGAGNTNDSSEETFNKKKVEKEYHLLFENADKTSAAEESAIESEMEGNKGNEGGRGRGTGQGSGSGIGGGSGTGSGTGGKGSQGGGTDRKNSKKRKRAVITSGFYFSSNKGRINNYKLVIHTDKDVENASISFTQYGDSGGRTNMSSKLLSVKDDTGNYNFRFDGNGYVIEGINLKAGLKNVFDAEFEEIEPSAFKFN